MTLADQVAEFNAAVREFWIAFGRSSGIERALRWLSGDDLLD